MEFSSFSTGIEHAVKTWQAAIGTREDGIMTAELLERLYMKQQFEDGGTNLSSDQEATTMFPQTKVSHLDISGRPVAVLQKTNVVPELN